MRKLLFGISVLLMGAGPVLANEYPTNETVHYALNCMNELGGQTDENLYTCTCRYDAIRETMTFSDYEEGRTFERNKKMPGEKGSFFRDNERGERLYEELVKAREAANANCIVVKQVKMVKPTNLKDKATKK
jgi:hypothetical protein